MGSVDGGVISLGPWGRQSGDPWSFRASREITDIYIRADSTGIVSISFSDAGGRISGTFGGNNSSSNSSVEENNKVEIRSRSESLKSMSGTHGFSSDSVTMLSSLSFTTNLTTYGPFGTSRGGDVSFFIPISDNVEVVGFFGRADSHVNALGMFLRPVPSQGSISVGPWGGPGGDAFSFKIGSGISQITVRDDSRNIKSVSFKDANGHEYGVFGGLNPNNIGTERIVELDGQSEYVRSITGTYGNYNGLMVVTSLSFVTNLSTYGPFGGSSGTSFSLPIEGSFVNGFHGRSGYYLDAIGFHCKATPPVIQEAISLGPWGGPGGDPWSYITDQGINQIIIYTGLNVKSISFQDTSGLASATFGGNNPNDPDLTQRMYQFRINWPDEYLISISGTQGYYARLLTITSLSFATNRTVYGPFGTTSGTPFSIPLSSSTIVGFHGRAGHYLDAIGISVIPLDTTT